MINILYAINGVFNKGGTEAVILNYYNNINKFEYHIDFLVHGYEKNCLNNEIHKDIISKGSKIFYVIPRGENYLRNKNEIQKILQNNHYDIVHSHMDSAGSFLLKEAKKAGIKVRVAHSHNTNNQIDKGNPVKNFAYKKILDYARNSINKYASVKLACSKEAGEWLYGNSDFIVINNSIDTDKFRYNQDVRSRVRKELNISDKTVIGHIGRFSNQKNHMFLIDIFYEYQKLKNNAFLLLVGSGELEGQIKEKAKSLDISDKVLFLGLRNDTNELMQAMDLFLLPSLFEGLPVVGIEAQASGLPCLISETVSSSVKITPTVVFQSLTNSPKEWALNINDLINDYKRTDTSQLIIDAGYDIKSTIDKLESIYLKGFEG